MLPRSHRITKTQQYNHIYKSGKRYFTPFAVFIVDSKVNDFKMGVVASKKVGNAVERNRAKRIVREGVRAFLSDISTTTTEHRQEDKTTFLKQTPENNVLTPNQIRMQMHQLFERLNPNITQEGLPCIHVVIVLKHK